jgi:hypothetical protein
MHTEIEKQQFEMFMSLSNHDCRHAEEFISRRVIEEAENHSSQSLAFGDSWNYDHSTASPESWNEQHLEATLSEDTETAPPSKLVHVSVMGAPFMLEPIVFEKLSRLPWQSNDTGLDCFSLNTSPELFEVLINHVIYKTLPNNLSQNDIEELEPMAILLGLQVLENHLQLIQKKFKWQQVVPRRHGAKESTKVDANKAMHEAKVRHSKHVKKGKSTNANVLHFFLRNSTRSKHEKALQYASHLS